MNSLNLVINTLNSIPVVPTVSVNIPYPPSDDENSTWVMEVFRINFHGELEVDANNIREVYGLYTGQTLATFPDLDNPKLIASWFYRTRANTGQLSSNFFSHGFGNQTIDVTDGAGTGLIVKDSMLNFAVTDRVTGNPTAALRRVQVIFKFVLIENILLIH